MKRILFTLPLVVFSALIIILSHQSGITKVNFYFSGMDKIIHALAFFIYGLFAQVAFLANFRKLKNRNIIFIAVIFSLIFAVLDEYHQSFISGRNASFYDFLADAFGVFASIMFFNQINKVVNKYVKVRSKKN